MYIYPAELKGNTMRRIRQCDIFLQNFAREVESFVAFQRPYLHGIFGSGDIFENQRLVKFSSEIR